MTEHRRSGPDRARNRLIRELATATGIPYSVAAQQLEAADEMLSTGRLDESILAERASRGRTVYPSTSDTYRRQLIEARARRTFAERVRDARLAARLPDGRARHLADRFPPTRGEPGTGVGPLYHQGDHLRLLYRVLADEAPPAGDLARAAELGEETAVDMVCAELDRAARRLLDQDRDRLWARIGGPPVPLDGAGHILDALLIVAEDGHAPGTRVRLRTGRHGTIVAALWGPTGPPVEYRVHLDGGPDLVADPDDLLVLPTDR